MGYRFFGLVLAVLIGVGYSNRVYAEDTAPVHSHDWCGPEGPTTTLNLDPSIQQVEALRNYQQEVVVLARLQDKKILTEEQVTSSKFLALAHLSKTMGQAMTDADVKSLLDKHDHSGLSGLFTFINIVKFLAALALIISLGWLLRVYLCNLPVEFYEIAAWAACVVGLASKGLWPSTDMWLVLPAAIGLIGCIAFTAFVHFEGERKNLAQVLSGICCAVWGFLALQYQSETLGFMSVVALESFLGFSVLVMPLCICLGFDEKDAIPRAMSASLVVLATYVGTHIAGTPLKALVYFQSGGLFMGSFVYYLGCLIVSSSYYDRRRSGTGYLLAQVLTIVSGVAALYFGAQFHIPLLLGIGGTFFVIYLLEKYYEIPWKNVGWAWSLLGLSGGLYGLSYFAWNHPQYFLWGVTQ